MADVLRPIYIKHLPKDKLLFKLWEQAQIAEYFSQCMHRVPVLTQNKALRDVVHFVQNRDQLELTTYYGRLIYADLSKDFLDPSWYNYYNGRGKAQRIIRRLKLEELKKTILKYYVSF